MKSFLLGLSLVLFSSFAFADEEQIVGIYPTLHMGAGIEMPTGMNKSTYGVLVLKGYVLHLGPNEDIGIKVLGLGASLNAHGDAGVVLSPVSYCLMRVCVGPEFIIPSVNTTNYGITVSYRF